MNVWLETGLWALAGLVSGLIFFRWGYHLGYKDAWAKWFGAARLGEQAPRPRNQAVVGKIPPGGLPSHRRRTMWD